MSYKIYAMFTLAFTFLMSNASAQILHYGDLKGENHAWFYNKPSATVNEFLIDLSACGAYARSLVSPEPLRTNTLGDIVYSIGGSIMDANREPVFVDNCMIMRDYRRYNVQSEVQSDFIEYYNALPLEEQLSYLTDDTPPRGNLARVWKNDLVSSGLEGLEQFEYPSFLDMIDHTSSSIAPSVSPKIKVVKPIKNGKKISLSVGNGLALIKTSNSEKRKPYTLVFSKVEMKEGGPLNMMDDEGNIFFMQVSGKGAKKPKEYMFPLPSGTYALTQISTSGLARDHHSLCYGTIIFDINSDEVISLGEWHIENRKVETSLEDLTWANTFLLKSKNGELFANRLEAAEFTNGAHMVCGAGIGSNYRFALPNVAYIETANYTAKLKD